MLVLPIRLISFLVNTDGHLIQGISQSKHNFCSQFWKQSKVSAEITDLGKLAILSY